MHMVNTHINIMVKNSDIGNNDVEKILIMKNNYYVILFFANEPYTLKTGINAILSEYKV